MRRLLVAVVVAVTSMLAATSFAYAASLQIDGGLLQVLRITQSPVIPELDLPPQDCGTGNNRLFEFLSATPDGTPFSSLGACQSHDGTLYWALGAGPTASLSDEATCTEHCAEDWQADEQAQPEASHVEDSNLGAPGSASPAPSPELGDESARDSDVDESSHDRHLLGADDEAAR
jgi:hypothetical protein